MCQPRTLKRNDLCAISSPLLTRLVSLTPTFFLMSEELSDIGLIGLAVMGQNLALNIADHGFRISVFNRTTSKTDKFVAENPDTPGCLLGTDSLNAFAASLKRPRKIIILVQVVDLMTH